ncbi:MAG: glycoside hydrolase family 13 protein [Mycobacteriales bacterium]
MASADPAAAVDPAGRAWWRDAVFYQIYVRSFADGGGDGVGDLLGARERVDYLALLGVDGVWLTPFYPSPMADHGYDVADPRAVDPLFGDIAAFDALISNVHAHGLKLLVDLVPNHTSDQHGWFQVALAAPAGSPERARYHFRAGRGRDGAEPPNNWLSVFGGPAWKRAPDGEWYLHLFAPEQPDLNWDNPEVVADLERTMTFWLDRGVDGFRIDVAHGMAKHAGLPDMDIPPGTVIMREVDSDPRFDQDVVHDVHRMVRRTLDRYPGRMAIGEVWVSDDERLSRYVRPDELHQAFNFYLLQADWDADSFGAAIRRSYAAVTGVGAAPTWVLSNHDVSREVTRYGGGELGLQRARAAALLILALPGSVYIYNGGELGLPDVDLPDDALQDPTWERSGHAERGRDSARVPMPWSGDRPPYGFSTEGTCTWLPMPPNWAGLTVEAELDNAGSMLSLYRQALSLRRSLPALAGEGLSWYGAPPGCLAFRRDGGLVCALNATDSAVPMPDGQVVLASAPVNDGMLAANAAVWLSGS